MLSADPVDRSAAADFRQHIEFQHLQGDALVLRTLRQFVSAVSILPPHTAHARNNVMPGTC